MNDRVVIHLDSEGVADVRLNRADKMNAIDSAMIKGILAAQDRLRAVWLALRSCANWCAVTSHAS